MFSVLNASQMSSISFFTATVNFLCRIPFIVILHWTFLHAMEALNTAYAEHLPNRDALRITHLERMHAEIKDKVEAKMIQLSGKKTIVVDGFEDRRKRHTRMIPICEGKACFETVRCRTLLRMSASRRT